ncbi:IS200/IS605 family accessory protein TnpB-related protein [Streptomyces sp. NBC_00638]|uniref:IS200/IS605 family accessory protein TnpB-related protein n=1 Tax=Streptomyces sp. NBC_00638 TaxID=2975794 RepID=UPI002B1E730C|nr:IS200/IS605 family accessory protein TnpB-related protein [Streptomyces sp. NBC_00638]
MSHRAIGLEAARAGGLIGVDTNADHFSACCLDQHGNPVGDPQRFWYDLTGSADHRHAQLRHALSQLLRRATRIGVTAVAVEDLDFSDGKTRERFGRRKRFRQLIHGIPTGKVKARLVNMAAEHGISLIAVDPAYTSKWGAEHWKTPLTSKKRAMTRHDAAGIAIGGAPSGTRSGWGYLPGPSGTGGGRNRPAPTRAMVAGIGTSRPNRAPWGARGSAGHGTEPAPRGRRPAVQSKAGNQRAQHRSGHATEHGSWQQDSLPLSS